ncbi:Thioredoxin protein 4B [Spatholobus suberectus]|nr:Thioredoxin protein 4B [Spatholobus suberectus]
MSHLLTTLSKKKEVDTIIRDTLEKVLVLRFGRASDLVCLQQDHIVCFAFHSSSVLPAFQFCCFFFRIKVICCAILFIQLSKAARDVSKFATVALVDVDSEDIQVYVKYFDITLIPSTVFFFNAHHMKMDYGTADHTKWIGAFHTKQDFIDVVEAIFRGAMKGKLIVNCPLPPEHIPKYQILYKDV